MWKSLTWPLRVLIAKFATMVAVNDLLEEALKEGKRTKELVAQLEEMGEGDLVAKILKEVKPFELPIPPPAVEVPKAILAPSKNGVPQNVEQMPLRPDKRGPGRPRKDQSSN